MNETNRSAYIAPISWGLGDLVVSLPAVQHLIDSGRATTLVTRHEMQRQLALCIDGLAGIMSEEELNATGLPKDATYYNLREHPIQRDYWWGNTEFDRDYPGYKINDILTTICNDMDLAANFDKLTKLEFRCLKEVENTVIFLPASDGTYKCWPKDNWLSIDKFLSAQGLKTALLGKPEHSGAVRELIDSGIQWLHTPMIEDALNLLSSCRFVIGVDTGLMHLAVHQGIRTISLYRPHPIYVRKQAHNFALIADSCHLQCIEKSLSTSNNELTDMSSFTPRTWTCEIDLADRCMSSISALRVIDILTKELLPSPC